MARAIKRRGISCDPPSRHRAAWTGRYASNKDPGVYHCICCDAPLFDSDTKFESGTGWPSFWQPIADEAVGTTVDRKFFMVRTEVHARAARRIWAMFSRMARRPPDCAIV